MSLWYSPAHPFYVYIFDVSGFYFGVWSEIGIQFIFSPGGLVSWERCSRAVFLHLSLHLGPMIDSCSFSPFLGPPSCILRPEDPCLMYTDVHQKSVPPQLSAWVHACVWAKSLRSCPTLCDPIDWSLLGSSVHGILQGKNTGVGYRAPLQGIFPTQGSNPCLLHCRQILYRWATGEAPS